MRYWAIVLNFIGLAVLVIVILRLRRIESRMLSLGAGVKPFWATVQSKLAKDLLHPSAQFQEMDELIRKLEALTIVEAERERLVVLLIERTTSEDPEVSASERESAKLMLLAMDKVLKEAESEKPLENVQLVGVKSEARDE